MDHFGGGSRFEIRPTIEQKPFENEAVQAFFTKWCEINDSIKPQIVTREQWNNQQTKGILEEGPDDTKILYIPSDLQLWEMIGVMETIDKDTFATKPERAIKAKEKMLALGKTFENAGIYIARRLNGIERGKEIAEALAMEFYEYGQSLTHVKSYDRPQAIDDIALQELTPKETDEVDRFLAGDSLYESRRQRVAEKLTADDLAEKDTLYETIRQKTLAQFFRAAEKAFALESKNTDGGLEKNPTKLKPWQSDTPIHSAFLKRIERALSKQIETPKRELESSIFRRGMEILQRYMPFDELPAEIKDNYLHFQNGEKTLREALKIDELREELDQIRMTGDMEKISAKEKEIADKIQKAVSYFPYQGDANNPSGMIASQYINCVGASTLGGALMKEAGLNYLVGGVPEHSILFLVTSDGQVEWRDMLNSSYNENLTDDMIIGKRRDGEYLTVNDIVAFSQKPTTEGFRFDINGPKYREKLYWVKEGQRQYVTVYRPEYGQQIQILNNTGIALLNLGRYDDAIEAFRQAIALDPKNANPYNGLGNALLELGRFDEAIEAYQQAIALDPKNANPYNGLGNALYELGRYDDAIEAFRQAIALDPEFAYSYNVLGSALLNLGRYDEAIKAYRQAITLDQKDYLPYNGLGNALLELGRFDEAIEAYQQAIALDPKNANPYNGLGNALYELGRYDDAIEAYQQAIALDPKNANPYNGLGNALLELGRYNEAIKSFQEAININPDFSIPYYNLGGAYATIGINDEAIKMYKMFIDRADKDGFGSLKAQAEQMIEMLNKN